MPTPRIVTVGPMITTNVYTNVGAIMYKPYVEEFCLEVKNAGAHSMDYQVMGSVDNVNFIHVLKEGTLNVGEFALYRDNFYIAAVKVQARSTVADQSTTAVATYSGLAEI